GLIGFSSGYYAMESCDALLMLGTDFPYRQFYPKAARIAQIDLRPEAIGRRAPVEIGLLGDVGATLRLLLPRLKARSDRAYLDAALGHYREARRSLNELATGRAGGPFTPSRWRARSGGWRARMRSSPATWGYRRCGPRAISP